MTEAPPFPIAATIAGVEVVTIPLADYAKLLECQAQLAVSGIAPARFAFDARSRIDRDPEVAEFLAERFGRASLKEVSAECRLRFGARSPGRSTIARFWDRLRLRRP